MKDFLINGQSISLINLRKLPGRIQSVRRIWNVRLPPHFIDLTSDEESESTAVDFLQAQKTVTHVFEENREALRPTQPIFVPNQTSPLPFCNQSNNQNSAAQPDEWTEVLSWPDTPPTGFDLIPYEAALSARQEHDMETELFEPHYDHSGNDLVTELLGENYVRNPNQQPKKTAKPARPTASSNDFDWPREQEEQLLSLVKKDYPDTDEIPSKYWQAIAPIFNRSAKICEWKFYILMSSD